MHVATIEMLISLVSYRVVQGKPAIAARFFPFLSSITTNALHAAHWILAPNLLQEDGLPLLVEEVDSAIS